MTTGVETNSSDNNAASPGEWDLILRSRKGLLDLQLDKLWTYRDLIYLLVRRDFVSFYKQTILGPLWYIIQPLLSTFVFTIVFGRIARIPTDGVPPFLFYFCGTVIWNYYSNSMQQISNTFIANAGIFGKVYFPRLVAPISTTIINVAQLVIQFALFSFFYGYYFWQGASFSVQPQLLLIPVLVLQTMLLSLGVGTIVSSITTRYRDLAFAVPFTLQLWMYATPVVYPLSQIPPAWVDLYMLNPMASIVETLRHILFQTGLPEAKHLAISWGITIVLLGIGVVQFAKTEKDAMDRV